MEEILHQWIGSLSHDLQVLNIPGGWEWDFFHQQYDQVLSGWRPYSGTINRQPAPQYGLY